LTDYQTKIDSFINDVIFRSKVVNYSKLKGTFSEDAIKKSIPNMTFLFCGRFVLKNLFYDESLIKKRDSLFKILKDEYPDYSKYVSKIRSILKEDMFLYHELTINNKLKGFNEDVEFKEFKSNKELIKEVITKQALSIEEISLLIKVSDDLIEKELKNGDFLKLKNNRYTFISENDSKVKKIITKLLSKKRTIRRNEVYNVMGIEDKQGFNEVVRMFCIPKGSFWVLK